jgi:hypothetical protein
LKQKFAIKGLHLWLFARAQWNEPLMLVVKDRKKIAINTTLALRRAELRGGPDV